MPRPNHAEAPRPNDAQVAAGALQSNYQVSRPQVSNPHLNCSHCEYPIECVEQNQRSGTWLGSFICPNCRSEYFYAYRWGRLMRKT